MSLNIKHIKKYTVINQKIILTWFAVAGTLSKKR